MAKRIPYAEYKKGARVAVGNEYERGRWAWGKVGVIVQEAQDGKPPLVKFDDEHKPVELPFHCQTVAYMTEQNALSLKAGGY